MSSQTRWAGWCAKLCVTLGAGFALSACTGNSSLHTAAPKHINNKTKFSSASYGVAASPRVTTSLNVRKGGGRRQIGKPYKVRGKWYTPREEPGYDRTGQASWYGPNFHGRLTANGEIYDQFALTAAHPTFPLPSYARVTNVSNGRSIVVRVNDRGPYHSGRIIDLSARASELLDYQRDGVARVRVQYIKQAPLHGRDHDVLMASYRSGEGGGTVMTASADGREPWEDNIDGGVTGSIEPSLVPETVPEPTFAQRQEPIGKDPFLAELEDIRAKRDNGSTLALRLQDGSTSNASDQ